MSTSTHILLLKGKNNNNVLNLQSYENIENKNLFLNISKDNYDMKNSSSSNSVYSSNSYPKSTNLSNSNISNSLPNDKNDWINKENNKQNINSNYINQIENDNQNDQDEEVIPIISYQSENTENSDNTNISNLNSHNDNDDDLPCPSYEESEYCPLPSYVPSVVRAGILTRKLELTSPYEAAIIRSWTKTLVVLNNTQLNFYKVSKSLLNNSISSASNTPSQLSSSSFPQCPGDVAAAAAIDIFQSSLAKTSKLNSSPSFSNISTATNTAPQYTFSTSPSSTLSAAFHNQFDSTSSSKTKNRNRSDSTATAISSFSHNSKSHSINEPTHATVSSIAVPENQHQQELPYIAFSPSTVTSSALPQSYSSINSFSNSLQSYNKSLPQLVRSYTLQYATVGVATDYGKRPHVLRLRAEGEQFLLECASDLDLIYWIHAIQAAIDLALPLDSRQLPKHRTIPRRRRRRRHSHTGSESNSSSAQRRQNNSSRYPDDRFGSSRSRSTNPTTRLPIASRHGIYSNLLDEQAYARTHTNNSRSKRKNSSATLTNFASPTTTTSSNTPFSLPISSAFPAYNSNESDKNLPHRNRRKSNASNDEQNAQGSGFRLGRIRALSTNSLSLSNSIANLSKFLRRGSNASDSVPSQPFSESNSDETETLFNALSLDSGSPTGSIKSRSPQKINNGKQDKNKNILPSNSQANSPPSSSILLSRLNNDNGSSNSIPNSLPRSSITNISTSHEPNSSSNLQRSRISRENSFSDISPETNNKIEDGVEVSNTNTNDSGLTTSFSNSQHNQNHSKTRVIVKSKTHPNFTHYVSQSTTVHSTDNVPPIPEIPTEFQPEKGTSDNNIVSFTGLQNSQPSSTSLKKSDSQVLKNKNPKSGLSKLLTSSIVNPGPSYYVTGDETSSHTSNRCSTNSQDPSLRTVITANASVHSGLSSGTEESLSNIPSLTTSSCTADDPIQGSSTSNSDHERNERQDIILEEDEFNGSTFSRPTIIDTIDNIITIPSKKNKEKSRAHKGSQLGSSSVVHVSAPSGYDDDEEGDDYEDDGDEYDEEDVNALRNSGRASVEQSQTRESQKNKAVRENRINSKSASKIKLKANNSNGFIEGNGIIGENDMNSYELENGYDDVRVSNDNTEANNGTEEGDEDELNEEKWMPDKPSQSDAQFTRYALRCLSSLPAHSAWTNKIVVARGSKYVIQHFDNSNYLEGHNPR